VLLVLRQRERRPEAGVLERGLRVGVVTELDLDHAVDVVELASGPLGPLFHRRNELLGVQFHALPDVQMKPSPERPA